MTASPTAASHGRNLFLDFAKGVLILLVVIGHSLQHAIYKDGDAAWSHPLFKAIYLFHMPLFMAVSGYLARPGIERSKLVPFLTSRLQSYIIPIFIWSLCFGIVMMLLTHSGPKSVVSLTFHEAIGTRFWFLWALLGSLIVTMLVRVMPLPFLPLYLLSTTVVLVLPDAGILYLFKYTYPFFQIGYLVSKHGVPAIVTKQRLPILAISGVLTVLGYLRWTDHNYVYLDDRMSLWHGNGPTVAFRFAANGVASLFAALAMYEIYRRWGGTGKGLLYRFGQDSIYIYIIQSYVFAILTELALRSSFVTPAPLASAVIAIVLGIFVTWLCWWLGVLLSRGYWMGRLLFGKIRKPTSSSST